MLARLAAASLTLLANVFAVKGMRIEQIRLAEYLVNVHPSKAVSAPRTIYYTIIFPSTHNQPYRYRE